MRMKTFYFTRNCFVCFLFQGHPRLVNAISALYSKHMGRDINPVNEVLVSVGAYGSLFYIFMGLVDPGDEVRPG